MQYYDESGCIKPLIKYEWCLETIDLKTEVPNTAIEVHIIAPLGKRYVFTETTDGDGIAYISKAAINEWWAVFSKFKTYIVTAYYVSTGDPVGLYYDGEYYTTITIAFEDITHV